MFYFPYKGECQTFTIIGIGVDRRLKWPSMRFSELALSTNFQCSTQELQTITKYFFFISFACRYIRTFYGRQFMSCSPVLESKCIKIASQSFIRQMLELSVICTCYCRVPLRAALNLPGRISIIPFNCCPSCISPAEGRLTK